MNTQSAQQTIKTRVDPREVTKTRARGPIAALFSAQPFWVLIALVIICIAMNFISDKFFSPANIFNMSRNFSFMAIIALGMTAVVITAGIDLSVGSVMGLCGIVVGLIMTRGLPIELALLGCLATAALCGLINGILVAYVGLSPFVVTLGMLSIARSLALVISNNKMVYEFGPDQELFLEIGGGATLGVANPLWILLFLTLLFWFAFRHTGWGRHVYAIGGNARAAKLTGVPVERTIVSVYILCSLTAGLSAFLLVGWFGSVTNALGQNYELRVIASTVIGGANLMGGSGYAFGAAIGAALVEVIRNALLLAGVDPYWQGAFLGFFIIFAVVLEKIRGRSPS